MCQFHRRHVSRLFASLSLAIVFGTGCHTLDTSRSGLADNRSVPPAAQGAIQQASATAVTSCSVELRGHNRAPKRVMLPIDHEMNVQELLEKSGALKQYRRMDVVLYRRTPTGKSHKMSVGFDTRARKVEPQNDYAIHPDDVLVVTEDTSTMVDDLLKKAGGSIPFLGGGSDKKG